MRAVVGHFILYDKEHDEQSDCVHLPFGPASILRIARNMVPDSCGLYQEQMTVTSASVSMVILAAAKFDKLGSLLKTVNTLSATAMFSSRH